MTGFPTAVHASHQVMRLSPDHRTFVCGDLHGCHDELMAALKAIAFDPARDKLIALGDLADCGLKNADCLKLLEEPWFHSVLGNHDDMLLNAINPPYDRVAWHIHGGNWFGRLEDAPSRELIDVARRRVAGLPLIVTLIYPDGSRVWLIQADPADDWHDAILGTYDCAAALWGRSKAWHASSTAVQHVNLVLTGHTAGNRVRQFVNIVNLDTGAGFENGRLTVIEIGTSVADLQLALSRRMAAEADQPSVIFEPLCSYNDGVEP